jgi:hypothetical protein
MPVVVLSSDPDGAHVRAATWDGQRLTQLGCYVVRAAVNDIPFDANWDFVFKNGHFEFRDRVTGELFHPARQPCH